MCLFLRKTANKQGHISRGRHLSSHSPPLLRTDSGEDMQSSTRTHPIQFAQIETDGGRHSFKPKAVASVEADDVDILTCLANASFCGVFMDHLKSEHKKPRSRHRLSYESNSTTHLLAQ